ncbi:MAG: adenylate kinase [Alphaproteobacteria bacterium]|nr:adenylate kinase [Alphaproteobacteria bacterium]
MNFILLGPPGSGKGTQGEYLEKKLGVARLSTGDILREEVRNKTEIGLKVQSLMEAGQFASDDIVIDLIKNRIYQFKDKGFILDGFPRNIVQAKQLDSILKEVGASIDFVLNFIVEEKTIVNRISGRYFCSQCKATYNKTYKNPSKEGICDECGSDEFQSRADDREDVVRSRFKDYNDKTLPLVKYYEEQYNLHNIDAGGDVKDVSKKIDSLMSKSN